MASASARIVVTACALDGLAASAAAAAAALNASRRGTSVVGASSKRVACSRVSMRVACGAAKRLAGVLCSVVRSRSPRIACNGGPRGAWSDATHAAHRHRRRLCMIEQPKIDANASRARGRYYAATTSFA